MKWKFTFVFRPKPDAAAEVSIETDEPISADDNEP